MFDTYPIAPVHELDELIFEEAKIIMVDGEAYDDDECYHCARCGKAHIDRYEMTDDWLCEDCAH